MSVDEKSGRSWVQRMSLILSAQAWQFNPRALGSHRRAGKTPSIGIVQMDVRDFFASEHGPNRGLHTCTLTHQRVSHQMLAIVCAYGDETRPNIIRDHARVETTRRRRLAHKDRTGRPIRRARRLMFERQQQQLIADIRIGKANATGISWFRCRENPPGVARRKLRIGKRKKVREGIKRQTDQSKGIPDAPDNLEGYMIAQLLIEVAPFSGFKFAPLSNNDP
jgi:hypothetical protein